jgi:hypothetical protein
VISLKRFYDLEHEFRQVAAKIAISTSMLEVATLLRRRMNIVAEARDIVNQLNAPEQHWCDSK